MTAQIPERDFHAKRPCVYLDQWVWIRLARAATGRPREEGDDSVLEAVRRASEAGVAFPLSATHYIETSHSSERHRSDLSKIMAEISHCRTLRSRKVLLRHQLLEAMHREFGRPTFQPESLEPLGVGVHWAFLGQQHQLNVHGPNGVIVTDQSLLPPGDLCRAMQWAETQFLAGPRDDEVELLRQQYGYMPEKSEEAGISRLEWEKSYVDLLQDDPISRAELRVRVQAREVAHEHLDMLVQCLKEYGISLDRLTGGPSAVPGSGRPTMTAFFDSMPSVRVAVDLKVELFRNRSNNWTVNDLYDIDAVSFSIPYCHVVVADKAK